MNISAYEFEQKQRECLPQKYVNFKRRKRNYRKRQLAITFILLRANAFSVSDKTVGFIPTTEASTGISRLLIVWFIHFRPKSVGHTLIMRFRYEMYMCIGIRVADNVGGYNRPIDRNEGLSIGLLFYQRLLSMILNYLISV